jgi:hypothetical protein
MANHNYLVPWEIVVSNNVVTSLHDKQSLRKNLSDKHSKSSETENIRQTRKPTNSGPGTSITLRAYIGMEYECPCGHRFICSGPDRLVKLSNNGVVKVKLYFLSGQKLIIAQLNNYFFRQKKMFETYGNKNN